MKKQTNNTNKTTFNDWAQYINSVPESVVVFRPDGLYNTKNNMHIEIGGYAKDICNWIEQSRAIVSKMSTKQYVTIRSILNKSNWQWIGNMATTGDEYLNKNGMGKEDCILHFVIGAISDAVNHTLEPSNSVFGTDCDTVYDVLEEFKEEVLAILNK